MNIWNVLLWSGGAVAALGTLCLFVIWLEKKGKGSDFDEQQRRDQGNANTLALWIGVVYGMVLIICYERDCSMPFGVGTMIFLGVLLEIIVIHIYCLLKRALSPRGQANWTQVWTNGLLSALCLARCYLNGEDLRRYAELMMQQGHPLPEHYGDTFWLTLFMGLTFGTAALLYLVDLLWKERENFKKI